jgi:hypothetical protein
MDDDDLPLSITHSRDSIVVDGVLEEDYRYLVYRFAGDVVARAYLDDIDEVSILSPHDSPAIPEAVMRYLQRRFLKVNQLGGPQGYHVIWQAD